MVAYPGLMSGQAAWLPEGLEPVALRLARADDAAFRIGELALAWSAEGPLSVREVESESGRVDVVLDGIRPIPPLLPMLFSEAINHTRSAIDNVVFHSVALRRTTPLTEAQARRISMPIYDDPKKFHEWLRANSKQGIPELGPGSLLGRRLESLQPFVDASVVPSHSLQLASIMQVQSDDVSPLLLLQGYSNRDKHRMILLGAGRTSTQSSDESFAEADKRMRPLEPGQILATTQRGSPVMLETSTGVHIERPSGSAWVAPLRELDHIIKHASRIAVPTILLGMAVTAGLPPEIDLSDDGQTDRKRIDAGGWTWAYERSVLAGMPSFMEALQAAPTILALRSDDPDVEN